MASRCQPATDGAGQPLRELLARVGGDLFAPVTEAGVGEAPKRRRDVLVDVGARRPDEHVGDLRGDAVEEFPSPRIGHDEIDRGEPVAQAVVRGRRVERVQDARVSASPTARRRRRPAHPRHRTVASAPPIGARRPTASSGSARTGQRVVDADARRRRPHGSSSSVAGTIRSTMLFGNARCSPIHSASDASPTAASSVTTDRSVEPFADRLSRLNTVRSPAPPCPPVAGREHEVTDDAAGRVGMVDVVADVGMGPVETPGGRVDAVSLLRDGHRDDRRVGRRQRLAHRGAAATGRAVPVSHGSDDPVRRRRAVDDAERVQAVLRIERVRHVVVAQRHADDPQALVARGEQVVGVHREVGPGERAEPQMHDAAPHLAAVVAGGVRIRRGHGRVGETWHHASGGRRLNTRRGRPTASSWAISWASSSSSRWSLTSSAR